MVSFLRLEKLELNLHPESLRKLVIIHETPQLHNEVV